MPTRFILDGDDVVRSSFWTPENLAGIPEFVPFSAPGDIPRKGMVPAPPSDLVQRYLGNSGWKVISFSEISGAPAGDMVNSVNLAHFNGSADVSMTGKRLMQVYGQFTDGRVNLKDGHAGCMATVSLNADIDTTFILALEDVEVFFHNFKALEGVVITCVHDGNTWQIVGISKFTYQGNTIDLISDSRWLVLDNTELQIDSTLVTFGSGAIIQLHANAVASWRAALGFGVANGFASLDGNGKLDPNQIPSKAIEVTTTVANQAARLALTITAVQNGDRVFQTDTSEYWELINDAAISTAASWLKRSPYAWAEISNKPTTLAGYGITDGVPSSRFISTTGLLSGGGNLTANRTLDVPLASLAEVSGGAAVNKAVTPQFLRVRYVGDGGLRVGDVENPAGAAVASGVIDVQAIRYIPAGAFAFLEAINIGNGGGAPAFGAMNIGTNGLADGDRSINFGYAGGARGTSAINLGSFGYATTECVNIGPVGAAGSSGKIQSINIGYGGYATGHHSVSVGAHGNANADRSCNFGYTGVAGDADSVNVGAFGAALGASSVNIGAYGAAQGSGSVTIGFQAATFNDQSIAVGYLATCHGPFSCSVGIGSDVNATQCAASFGGFGDLYTPHVTQLAVVDNTLAMTAAVRVHGLTKDVVMSFQSTNTAATLHAGAISGTPDNKLAPGQFRIRTNAAGTSALIEFNIGGAIKTATLALA